MELARPIVLSIAGFDPSGGAGILADIKTFEQHKVYGLGVSTAQTLQTEEVFYTIKWEDKSNIITALKTMLSAYDIKCIKIGIVEDMECLDNIVDVIHRYNKEIKIVIDTIFTSSTGFKFREQATDREKMLHCFSKAYLITPNYEEVLLLMPSENAKVAAKELSKFTNVLLKGGHNMLEEGTDYLYSGKEVIKINSREANVAPKHGSGCVLSSAITAQLALGKDLLTACVNAKEYITSFLESNTSKLGYHYV